MARARRKRQKPIKKPQQTQPQPLTDADIDHYFAVAAATIKEVEQQLQSTLKLPASSLLLRIQSR
jgi:hypothetical protein